MKLSVIICTYNRAIFLPDALESIASQDIEQSQFELILIDNNSTDNTREVCQVFETNHPGLIFKYFKETKQGLSFARNRGIAESKGDLIAFIDDDAVAETSYVRNIIKAFALHPECDAVGGKVLPVYPGNAEPPWMSKYIEGVVSKVDYGNEASEFFRKKYPVGCNMIFRKEIFAELGGFNEDLKFRSDDKFIFLKLREHRKRILYSPDIVVHHVIDASRLTFEFIRKLCHQIGGTERIRLKDSIPGLFSKLCEYVWKMLAAFVLALIFIMKGQKGKASYILLVRWFILTGFFRSVRYIRQKY
ncbi:MAG: glycosyltransferase [Bacteroidia bacterium]|nr:glycosyltransferase [Bacteroidia bacterium]